MFIFPKVSTHCFAFFQVPDEHVLAGAHGRVLANHAFVLNELDVTTRARHNAEYVRRRIAEILFGKAHSLFNRFNYFLNKLKYSLSVSI